MSEKVKVNFAYGYKKEIGDSWRDVVNFGIEQTGLNPLFSLDSEARMHTTISHNIFSVDDLLDLVTKLKNLNLSLYAPEFSFTGIGTKGERVWANHSLNGETALMAVIMHYSIIREIISFGGTPAYERNSRMSDRNIETLEKVGYPYAEIGRNHLTLAKFSSSIEAKRMAEVINQNVLLPNQLFPNKIVIAALGPSGSMMSAEWAGDKGFFEIPLLDPRES